MNGVSRRLFAVIPAAGRSRRMGRPKLLLPWLGTTIIEHLIGTLTRDEITATMVVTRPDDAELQAVLRRTPVIAVIPDHEPPTMRDSVEVGLRAIKERFAPLETDGWLLIPADHPLLERSVLDDLLTRWAAEDCDVLVPKYGAKRGHPTLLRWALAAEVEQLPQDVGINTLLRSPTHVVTEWQTDRESVLADLDTPEDYTFWQQRLSSESTSSAADPRV